MSSATTASQEQQAPTLEPIKFKNGILEVLDQLLIPQEFKYEQIHNVEEGFASIVDMKVRGAPAIAIVAILSLAVEVHDWIQTKKYDQESVHAVGKILKQKLDYLQGSRPTAVNLFIAVDEFKARIEKHEQQNATVQQLLQNFMEEAEKMIELDVQQNATMSKHGSQHIQQLLSGNGKSKYRVLTHCNTGALATSKYGTALGVIRFLYQDNKLERVFATETRPYNQGARLTVFEMAFEKIPVTLVVDSAVSYLLQSQNIDSICVGADRICANGDTANKIGTYQIAISANYHKVPFFIVAPISSIDTKLEHGSKIKIEERKAEEVSHNPYIKKKVIADGVDVWNPGFDVVPAKLITAIITELGVIDHQWKNEDGTFRVNDFINSKKQQQ